MSSTEVVNPQRGGIKAAAIRLLAGLGFHVKLNPFRVQRTARIRTSTRSVRSVLGAGLQEPVRLEHRLPRNELFDRFRARENVHKWHHYFDVYSEEFEGFRDRPIRMLEIGVFRGGSLPLWKEWFHPESVIVGLDIDPDCRQYEKADQGIHVRIGDQSDPGFLAKVVEEFGPFDLILDDGGHTSTQMIASFNALFRPGLVEGGRYMVEDTHTNYWPGYVDSKMSFIDFCKGLVELSHAHYFPTDSIDEFAYPGDGKTPPRSMPYIQAWLHRVAFYDSIIVLEKRERILPVHELR